MARGKRTQAALADTIGMKQQSLSRRLSGQTAFSLDELGRVAAALETSLICLIGEAEAKAVSA